MFSHAIACGITNAFPAHTHAHENCMLAPHIAAIRPFVIQLVRVWIAARCRHAEPSEQCLCGYTPACMDVVVGRRTDKFDDRLRSKTAPNACYHARLQYAGGESRAEHVELHLEAVREDNVCTIRAQNCRINSHTHNHTETHSHILRALGSLHLQVTSRLNLGLDRV